MRTILVLALLAGIAAPAFSCDVSAGAGKVFRGNDGEVGGFATVACVWKDKYEVRAWYVGEQRIYGDSLRIGDFWAVSGSRLWTFRDEHRVRPFLGAGVLLKEDERCHFNGDIDCNRLLPLSYAFLFIVGVRFPGDWQLVATHASNNSMDWGPEKKNLGFDGLRLEVVF